MKKHDAFIYFTFPASVESQFPRFGRILHGDFTRPHVSLLYLPGISEQDIQKISLVVEKLSSSIEPFEIEFGEVKHFKSEDKDIPWYVEINGEDILDIRDAICSVLDKLNIEREDKFKNFIPHATLQYLSAGKKYEGPCPSGKCTIDQIHFAFKDA